MNPYVQLHSARNMPLEESLAMIAHAGFWGVEANCEHLEDLDTFQSLLSRHDLEVPSIHISLDENRENLDTLGKKVESLGCTHVAIPGLDEGVRPDDAAGWQALGQELNDLQKRWKDYGCKLGWHNHDFELTPLEDGTLPIDHLMDTATKLRWEPDIAWIVKAGVEPLPLLERYKKRLTVVQLKDIAVEGEGSDEDGWADVGAGQIDWQEIMPTLLGSRAMYYVVEHNQPSDFQRFLKRSNAAVSQFFGQ